MRVLITGGLGFVGRALTKLLLDHGHEVVVIDNLSTALVSPTWFAGRSQFDADIADVRDVEAPTGRIDRIVHLAGPVGAFHILDRPRLEAEILGLARHVTNWAVNMRVPLLFLSTLEAEDTLVRPQAPRNTFIRAKRRAEMEIAFTLSRASLPYWVLRSCTIAGPGQSSAAGFAVPRMMEQAQTGRPITVFGDGHRSHELLHVDDVARAVEISLFSPAGTYVARGMHTRVIDLAQRIKSVTASRSEIAYLNPRRAVHPLYREPIEDLQVFSPSVPGWAPKESMDRILSDAIVLSRRCERRRSVS